MRPFLKQLRLASLYRQLVADPTRTELIFKAIDVFKSDANNPARLYIEKRMMAEPEFKADFERGYMPKVPNMARLAQYAPGTFGEAVFRHYKTNGLDPEYFPAYDENTLIGYISGRLYQAHDLWHVLLGYSIEIEDELALQAFGVAQYGSGIAVMILSGGLLHLLRKDALRALKAVELIAEGFMLGKQTPALFARPLYDWFDLPLEEVRRRCGIRSAAPREMALQA